MILKLSSQTGKKHKRAGQNGIPTEAISIYCRKIREWFGQGGFKTINKIANCIDYSSNWSIDNSQTKAYWLTSHGKSLIEEARQQACSGAKNLLLNADGSLIRRKPNGVYTSRDNHGKRAVTNAFLEGAIPIDVEAISSVLRVGVAEFFPNTGSERLARIDCALRAIHLCALNDTVGRGLIPQKYSEARSGRLYGCGSLSLQNVIREAKQVALLDAHEYDFSNCHYRFLGHVSTQNGFNTPIITEYLREPKAFRQELADELGITYEQAKTCLLAALYGAKKSLWHESAYRKEIGLEKATKLWRLPRFEGLLFEIVEVGSWMIENANRTRRGAIVNCRGKSLLDGDFKQELAHLLQGLEAELLHLMIDEYGDDMLIIQHDGFTMRDYQDPADIEADISYLARIEMPVTHEQLTLPGIS